MIKSTENRGFQMTFENGWTVSVQFGTNAYCERRSFSPDAYKVSMLPENRIWSSETAEIAAWDADGYWFKFGDDNSDDASSPGDGAFRDEVKGWCAADEVADFITKIKNLK